jgi:hypothetical protein
VSVLAVAIGQLAQVIWVSIGAGVGVTAAFSFVVLGTARSAEARRSGRSRAALGYGALSAVFLLLFAAGVVLGVRIMLTKG